MSNTYLRYSNSLHNIPSRSYHLYLQRADQIHQLCASGVLLLEATLLPGPRPTELEVQQLSNLTVCLGRNTEFLRIAYRAANHSTLALKRWRP